MSAKPKSAQPKSVKPLRCLLCLVTLCLTSAAFGQTVSQTGKEEATSAATVPAFADIFGKPVAPLRGAGRKATVLFFVARECPIANFYAPEIRRLAAEYAPKGVASFVVYVEPDAKPADLRTHYKEFAFSCPALNDKAQTLIKRFKATRTPETVVLAPEGNTLYQGRIDDRYLDFGKSKHQPGRADLRLALDSILSGNPVRVPTTPIIGCPIPEAK